MSKIENLIKFYLASREIKKKNKPYLSDIKKSQKLTMISGTPNYEYLKSQLYINILNSYEIKCCDNYVFKDIYLTNENNMNFNLEKACGIIIKKIDRDMHENFISFLFVIDNKLKFKCLKCLNKNRLVQACLR